MPTIIEADKTSGPLANVVPPFKYDPLIIPAGRTAHVGEGYWLRRCSAPWCNVSWLRKGGHVMLDGSHIDHQMTHNIDVPGGNVGILP